MSKKNRNREPRPSARGTVLVLQKMGVMPDGKIHFVAGRDADEFHLEQNDEFFTAIFAVDPFKGVPHEQQEEG